MKKIIFWMIPLFLVLVCVMVAFLNDDNLHQEEPMPTMAATEESKATEAIADTTEAPTEKAHLTRPMNIGGLKGPTSMGLVWMMSDEEHYRFVMETAADAMVAQVISGAVDIALIPANLAANLYHKTEHQITVLEINTLGVLYIVERGSQIRTMADLKGKTLYMTGKGQTPEYALSFLMSQNEMSLDDLTIEFKSEATEVLSALSNDENGIALLPQPFVTSALQKLNDLRIALDLNAVWDELPSKDSSLVTGVTVVRNAFLEEYPDAVEEYLAAHKKAVEAADNNLEATAMLIEKAGIVKTDVALAAYPNCNIVSITGADMKKKLSGYLKTLYELNEKSIGGQMPGEDFYFVTE